LRYSVKGKCKDEESEYGEVFHRVLR
jgi:hypothetical protein